MKAKLGWGLAIAALAAGWFGWGWPGVALAVTVTAFWLLLEFNRALRTMRAAAARPLGTVPSAVMLHAQLHPGMTMLQVVRCTRSLGRRLSAEGAQPEVWRWADAGGVAVEVTLRGGTLVSTRLERPGEGPGEGPAQARAAAGPADTPP